MTSGLCSYSPACCQGPGPSALIAARAMPLLSRRVGTRSNRLHRVPLKIVFGDPIFFTPDSSREEVLRAIMRAIAQMLTEHGVPTIAKEDLAEAPPSEPAPVG